MLYGQALFQLGVFIICGAAGIALLSVAVFSVTGSRLRKTLDKEYGKKRRK